MHEVDTRRERWSRKSRRKHLHITERDIAIFQLLQRYRYLRSTFIWELLPRNVRGKSLTRFKERLGNLFHEGYLNRPRQQREFFNARYSPAIYELDQPAEKVLIEWALASADGSDLVSRGRMGAIRHFPHAMMICDTLASIELGVSVAPDIRFVLRCEIISKAPPRTRHSDNPFAIPVSVSYTYPRTGNTHRSDFRLIPDGLFGLEYTADGEKRYRFFAFEAERGNRVWCSNLKQTSWLKKTLAYRNITARKTYESHLGLPNMMVMVVTPTEHKIRTMIDEVVMQVTEGRGSTIFMFQRIPVMGYELNAPRPMPELLISPWKRAERPDFYIHRP